LFLDFDLFFDRPFYRFQRELKDMYPYEVVKKDNQVILVHNVVGLGKNDINIKLERDERYDYLVISGEKKNEITNKIDKVDSRFKINLKQLDKDGIEWKVEDGLLYIYITYQKPKQPEITIRYKE
jgi:HSP20 family molecular chaperone IbpA